MDVIERDPYFYKIFRPLITVVFKILYRPTFIGVENIPKKGKIIIAGNHTSERDCLLVLSSTKRVVHGLAKKELYDTPLKFFVKHLGVIPVDRKNKDHDALAKAEEFLGKGMCVGVFPEGTINRSEDVTLPFKIGAVKMAHDTNSMIVPFVIKGEYKLFRKSIRIAYFKPIKVKNKDLEKDNEILKSIVADNLLNDEV